MKPATTGLTTAMLGLLALIVHGAITFLTLLGTGLASTPDTPVPARAETLWGIALWGTPVAALALLILMVRWSRLAALAYACVRLVLTGCAVGGWLTYPDDASIPTGTILLQAVLPLASATMALYGVWTFRATNC